MKKVLIAGATGYLGRYLSKTAYQSECSRRKKPHG